MTKDAVKEIVKDCRKIREDLENLLREMEESFFTEGTVRDDGFYLDFKIQGDEAFRTARFNTGLAVGLALPETEFEDLGTRGLIRVDTRGYPVTTKTGQTKARYGEVDLVFPGGSYPDRSVQGVPVIGLDLYPLGSAHPSSSIGYGLLKRLQEIYGGVELYLGRSDFAIFVAPISERRRRPAQSEF